MAKKLLYDYTFDASAKTVAIAGHVDVRKLLFINNATRGTTIYALGDPDLKVTNTAYDALTDITTYTLTFDTSSASHADTDKLQIFIDEEGAEFKPTETFVDPVSKLRVSNPNTLIDTDFEYSLQSTKWETLERIHQIPSFYSSTGDVPLGNIKEINSVNGSKDITVKTNGVHGLVNGIPLDIRGLTQQSAEGTFIIKSIPDEQSFVYESNSAQTTTGDISTVYANVIIGRFYVGSSLSLGEYSAVTTDAAATSTLTIRTPVQSNYAVGTQFYITNSIAVKRKEFDGRAFTSGGAVDFSPTISYKETTQMILWKPEGNDTEQFLVPSASYMNSTTNTITHYVNGQQEKHKLRKGDFMFISYVNGNVTGFSSAGTSGTSATSTNGGNGIYYVIVVDEYSYKLANSPTNCAAGTAVSFTLSDTGQSATQLEMKLFGRGYSSTVMNPYEFDIIECGDEADSAYGRRQRFFFPESIDTSQYTITIPDHQFKDGQPVIFQRGPSPNSTPSSWNSEYCYYIEYVDADTIKLCSDFNSRDPNHDGPYYGSGVSNVQYVGNQGDLYTWGTPFSLWPCIKLARDITNNASGGVQDSQAWYNRNRIICEHSIVNFKEGDKICFHSRSNPPGNTNNTPNNWDYQMDERTYYVRYPAINQSVSTKNFEFSISRTPNGPIHDISDWPNTEHCFAYKIETVSTSNTWYSPQHGFTTNENGDPDYWLQYRFDSNNSVGSAVGNMSTNYWYWMIPVTNNHFRVSLASSDGSNNQPFSSGRPYPNQYEQWRANSYIINLQNFGGDGTNFRHKFRGDNIGNPYLDTFKIDNHGFSEGNAVRYNSNGNPTIQGLQNGQTYYCRNVTQDRFELSDSYGGTRLNISSASATSTPNHYFEDTSAKGSIDGAYEITSKNADELRYDMATNTQIFGKTLVFYPGQVCDLKRGWFYIKDHGLKTGTAVLYTVPTGGTAIGQNPPPSTAQQNAGYNSMTDNTTYYVRRISRNWFALATTEANAQNNVTVKEYFNLGNDHNDNYQHTLYATSVFGEVVGAGRITYTTKDKTWDGSNESYVNTYSNYVEIGSHQFQSGDFIEYNGFSGATPIKGLDFGEKYYIHRWGSSTVSFHKKRNDARRRRNSIKLYGAGTGTLHQIRYAQNVLKGTVDRGRWNSSTEYFVGDIVTREYNDSQGQPHEYYYVCSQDSLDNWDDLRYDYSDTTNINYDPPNDLGNNFWRRLSDYRQQTGGSTGGALETNMINQYTPGDHILLDDERLCGYDYGYGYWSYSNVDNGGIYVNTPSSNYHNFRMGDAVHYRNEGKWYALEQQATTLPTDYGGLEDGSIYFVNVVDYYRFSLHLSPDEARQGINAITLAYASGNSSYYNMHRFYRMEPDIIPIKIISITDQNEMTVEEPSLPRVIEFDPQETQQIYIEADGSQTLTTVTVCDTENEMFFLKTVEGVEGANAGTGGGKYYGWDKYMRTGTRVIYSHATDDSNINGFSKDYNYFVINMGNGYYRFYGNGNNNSGQRQNSYSGYYNTFSDTGQGNNHTWTICTENWNNHNYIIPTNVYVKPSSYALHRPFDGGVEINPGKSADSSIVRQTRRYFRYQSGKGLQYSTATNFNPPLEVKTITGGTDGSANPNCTIVTRRPHFLNVGDYISLEDVTVSGGTNHYLVDNAQVATVTDEFTFTYLLAGTPSDSTPSGFPTLHKNGWNNAVVRAGMFDDQNGFFFEYDGQNLNAVRRSSTQQVGGTVTATKDSQTLNGNGTTFTKQLSVDDYIVLRGMSYKVAYIQSDTELYMTTAYRGVTSSNIIMTLTVDTKTPTTQFNLDKCDGTGQSGFELNVKRLQMAYIDYSWYGGGKIRYGFKDQHGRVFYAHQYIHSNIFNEAYFRSGNLPARYEVSTIGDRVTGSKFSPSLFHWGASVIMDGQFEDDKAYLFSAASDTTYLLDQKEDGDEDQANRVYPMLSIRLAPSVDAGVKGNIGTRDLINRMQLQLKAISVTLSDGSSSIGSDTSWQSQDPKKSCTVRLILNGDLSSPSWVDTPSPGLSQVVYHTPMQDDDEFAKIIDRVNNGINLLEFRANANTTTEQILGEVATLGNSIMGGDYTYPNGPDTLTIAVIPDHTYTSSSRQYTICSTRITWTESQA